jgi:hypothetical protein
MAEAADAVLNVQELRKLLRGSDLTVQSGIASGILVNAPIKWTKGTTLTLAATGGITFNAPLRVEGIGGLVLTSNEGKFGPRIAFVGDGSATFLSVNSQLMINGETYKLESNIRSLADDIANSVFGNFALANDYDASVDGVYAHSPINSIYSGHFEGLGHTVSNLQIVATDYGDFGMFLQLSRASSTAWIRDIRLQNIFVKSELGGCVGGLAGNNQGHMTQVFVSGEVAGGQALAAGGAVGCNSGVLDQAQASVFVSGNVAGSLVGDIIDGAVQNSFATGSVVATSGPNPPEAGGLAGDATKGSISSSYATGPVSGQGLLGGILGSYFKSTFSNVYWDTTTSGLSVGCGLGSCEGVTGQTTAELQAGLPEGFDPAIWTHKASINDGLPYLRHLPPR